MFPRSSPGALAALAIAAVALLNFVLGRLVVNPVQSIGAGEVQDRLYARYLELVEPPLLQVLMERYHGNCAAAAQRLGIHRTTLKKKLDEYGMADGGS